MKDPTDPLDRSDRRVAPLEIPVAMSSETSPVYGYMKNPSLVDYPGNLAAVMFTTGCNFKCGFCHNANLMGKRQEGLSWAKLGQACRQFKDQWVTAVCISGGEPTLWGSDLIALVNFFRKNGLKIKLDTNGSRPDVLAEVLPVVDYVAMDVKCALASYPDFVGFTDVGKIAESLDLIRNSEVDYEFRTTVIESIHTDEEMTGIKLLVTGAKRYCMQPFLPREDLPDEAYRKMFRTDPARMQQLGTLMADCADEVVVRGN